MIKSVKIKPSALMRKADQAMKQAIRKVMIEHRRLGLPVYILQGSKVVKIPPHRLPSR